VIRRRHQEDEDDERSNGGLTSGEDGRRGERAWARESIERLGGRCGYPFIVLTGRFVG
jgi:hypothetical protein